MLLTSPLLSLVLPEEDAKHLTELEASNRTLTRELEELRGRLSSTEGSLRSAEEQKACFHQQLHKTVASLNGVMKDLQTVLAKVGHQDQIALSCSQGVFRQQGRCGHGDRCLVLMHYVQCSQLLLG